MDRRLLHLYNVELQHIRQMAGEFAAEYPKIAGRLALDKDGKEICPDPFVERLLEGFAFMAARVHLKLDAEFPRLTQSLLETVYPHYLSPTPSMAVVRFEPELDDAGLAEGFAIPRGTSLRSILGRGERTACEYRTAHAIKLWPIRLDAAEYYIRKAATLELPQQAPARAALRMSFRATAGLTFDAIHLDKLTFFLRGVDELPVTIFEQIFAHKSGVWIRNPADKGRGWTQLPKQVVRRVGLADDEALLPRSPESFEGYRLLMEYFAFPQRFLFFEIGGLADAVGACKGDTLELVVALDQADNRLEDRVDASAFDLFCTPVVNLFTKRTDRIPLTDRTSEFHVVADRTRPLDFEIYSVQTVTGYGTRAGEEQEFAPFYLARDTEPGSTGFYTVNRVPRVLTERERQFGKQSAYSGSEVYLSLVDASSAPYSSELQQLGVTALCTNRHLPIRMTGGIGSSDFSIDVSGPIHSVRCVTGPTAPRPSFAEGEMAWRFISHLSLNYLSISDSPGNEGATGLRELLKLYSDPNDRQVHKQIDGVRSITSTSIMRRVPTPGPITFARGLEVTVTLDENAFEGTGVFLLGMVLEQFFARHVALNSFTETVIRTEQRGEIIRWPTRMGRRQIL
ncbi:MAG TPA: type VI secretion system baseplate subunit TssF [Chthoniobacterales bacterium]